MILAADIGGTKTLIGLFEPGPGARPHLVDSQSFPTTDYDGLPAMIAMFMAPRMTRPRLTAAVIGVAGPVIGRSAVMTNVNWRVDAVETGAALGVDRVSLINDLEAMAYAVPHLDTTELRTLQRGSRRVKGNIAVVAAGTGFGGAIGHLMGTSYVPMASEIGHTDFPARTMRELEFVRSRHAITGRVAIEDVVCGPGLVNLAVFTHGDNPCAALTDGKRSKRNLPASVTSSALGAVCPACTEALDMFIDAYGAVAGNLALTAVTLGGMYIGGGIAPRILTPLEGGFLKAFADKPPMQPLLQSMPVHVILNDRAGLIGAAVLANQQLATQTR